MNYEILSIDTAEELEKLIRENGYLREERNKLEEQYDKHMKLSSKNTAINLALREQKEKAIKCVEENKSRIPIGFYYEIMEILEEEV